MPSWTKTVRDYLDLTKPRINGLVLVTAWAGMLLAGDRWPAVSTLVFTLLGTGLTVGGANVLNCYLEIDRDALMERTEGRPLPAGRIPPRNALVFGLVCNLLGLWLLATTVNLLSAGLAAVALVFYAPLYTLLKPMTSLSTLVGAVPGALPPVIGWTAVTGRVELPAVVLFFIMFLWQPPHFLALALFYREDYRRAGHAMLPVEINRRASIRQILIYTAALIPLSLFPVVLGMSGWIYCAVALVMGAGFLVGALIGYLSQHGRRNRWARGLFLYSILYLTVVFGTLVLNRPGIPS